MLLISDCACCWPFYCSYCRYHNSVTQFNALLRPTEMSNYLTHSAHAVHYRGGTTCEFHAIDPVHRPVRIGKHKGPLIKAIPKGPSGQLKRRVNCMDSQSMQYHYESASENTMANLLVALFRGSPCELPEGIPSKGRPMPYPNTNSQFSNALFFYIVNQSINQSTRALERHAVVCSYLGVKCG